MGFLRRLWHRLLFGPSPLTAQPRPAAPAARPGPACPGPARPASPAASAADMDAIAATIRQWVKPQPPRCVYRSRDELELALLLAWLPETERRRFLDLLVSRARAGKRAPWALDDVDEELWQQCRKWDEPLVIQEPESMTDEGFCNLLEAQLAGGLTTFCTPLDLLSRPIRMLWLLRQGRLVGQVYAAMEQTLGHAQALDFAWWTIARV